MKRLGLLLALSGLIVGGLRAAELAPGLVYMRPGIKATPVTGSAVLDLRYVTDEVSAAPLLTAVEPGKANDRRIILVLVSPETPAGLRRQLIAIPRCLTLGRAAPELKTDIVVTTSAEADRRAFDALAAGTAPEKLLVENADKMRYDEASLVREHGGATESVDDADKAPTPESPTPATPTTPATPEVPVVDSVLQRAVQIHRGLTVLKKL
jgi:hypothetical protein